MWFSARLRFFGRRVTTEKQSVTTLRGRLFSCGTPFSRLTLANNTAFRSSALVPQRLDRVALFLGKGALIRTAKVYDLWCASLTTALSFTNAGQLVRYAGTKARQPPRKIGEMLRADWRFCKKWRAVMRFSTLVGTAKRCRTLYSSLISL
jgi:hypothetical protein